MLLKWESDLAKTDLDLISEPNADPFRYNGVER